jgi:predicted nucleic acid-binding protein
MSVLFDTNVLLRAAQIGHPMYQTAVDAGEVLRLRGKDLFLVPQNFYEFWVVATRPAAQNGLGFMPAQAHSELARFKALFRLLDDAPAIFPQWERLIVQHQVRGKNAHDARLVAAMMVHGIDQLLTFNVSDFQRYRNIMVLDPAQIAGSQTPLP